MKEVEEVLAVTALKKLLKLKHLIKKEILLGCWHSPERLIRYHDDAYEQGIQRMLDKAFPKYNRLFLTKIGLLVKESGLKKDCLVEFPHFHFMFLIDRYKLTHTNLNIILEMFKKNERS